MTRRVLGLVGLILLLAVPAASAQERRAAEPENTEFLFGTHAFRRILYDTGHKQLKPQPPKAGLNPADTLIVVLGDPAPLDFIDRLEGMGGLRDFVEHGGALLVATDQSTTNTVLGRRFGVDVTGVHLQIYDKEDAYLGMPECPFVEPEAGADPPLFAGFPAFRGQQPLRIACNEASYLHVFGRLPGLDWLAKLPSACVPDPATGGGRRWSPWPFAAGGRVGEGRLLIMADHSVFINEMMLQDNNGNIDFASRCADWLLAGRDGQRHQVLYYEDNALRTDFDLPLKNLLAPPLPPPETLLGMIDETLHGMEQEGTFSRMEDENFFDSALEDGVDELPFWERAPAARKIWTFGVLAASLAFGLYAFVRLGTFRRQVPTASSLAALLEKQAPAGAVLEQRREALLREGNLGEAARALARDLLASAGISHASIPAIAVRGGCWRRWRLRQRWRTLGRLARAAVPLPVSPRAFARLASQTERMRAALADGTVRIIR